MRRLPVSALSVLAACLLLAGCQRDGAMEAAYSESAPLEMADEMEMQPVSSAPAPPPMPAPQAADTTRRVLIRTSDVTMEVADVADARAKALEAVARYDAYVAGESENRDAYRIRTTLTIRVAAAQYDALEADLQPLALRVESREVSVRDVTEEYVDLSARLRARREVEKQYLTILARASSVEDVLRVQAALAQVREEIERAEGRLRFLSSQAAYSTLRLTLFEDAPGATFTGPGFFSKLGRALAGGWQGLLEVVVALAALWPLWLVVALVVVFVPRWLRRRRERPFPPPPTSKRA